MNRKDFQQGLIDIWPMALAYAPIALLWGTLAAKQGLSVFETTLMSFWGYSGAAQFVVIDMWRSSVPPIFLVLSILTVSLRHILMSASVSRHIARFGKLKASVLLFWLTDEAWAMIERRALKQTISPSYFAGVAIPIWPVWFGFSALGAWLGNAVGDVHKVGLDFAFAAMFIAVLAGFWKGRSTALVLIVSACVAVVVKLFVPGTWYILAGGLGGMVVAMAAYRPEAEHA
jgi:4-azaleucine resistance transporter AzlC